MTTEIRALGAGLGFVDLAFVPLSDESAGDDEGAAGTGGDEDVDEDGVGDEPENLPDGGGDEDDGSGLGVE